MDAKQKHTPGPWRVDYSQGIITQDGSPIAYVCDDYSDTPSPDARLIAAAPDLLEALKAMLFAFEELAKVIKPLSSDPVVVACRAIIAEAEGTTQNQ